MNGKQDRQSEFEDRLLRQLKAVVAERGAAEAVADASVARPSWRRPGFRVAFAAAGALAAVAAAILVISSGRTAQPAAAQILRETATAATAADGPASSLPGPGQLYYRKFTRVSLTSWVPGGEGMQGGRLTRPGSFTALMPTTQQWWTAADGAGRVREVAGAPRFLSDAERSRWEQAGSRLPAPFDPEYQRKYPLAFRDALELRRGVVDREVSAMKGFGFPDTSQLPTDPEQLRRAVERNRIPVRGFNPMYPGEERLDTDQVVAQLFNILQEGNPMEPQLRAAIFNALAELPGIEVDTEATDFLGRQGYSISLGDPRSGGLEFIFDPDTAEVLAQREFIGEPGASPFLRGLPAGLAVNETAYLEAGVVDSTRETAAEAEAGEPVASTGPVYRD